MKILTHRNEQQQIIIISNKNLFIINIKFIFKCNILYNAN